MQIYFIRKPRKGLGFGNFGLICGKLLKAVATNARIAYSRHH